ncbi:MAG: hypothetical protein HY842_07920 [Bacteroidetes bacterium]|nr:hypothetical protein [Bacteroidota bacterium]
MAHATVRSQLIALASSTVGNPLGYLDGLSPIHANWHSGAPRTYGFLLFHFRVVRDFRANVNSSLAVPVVPYTAAQLTAMGVAGAPPATAGVNTLAELRTFSQAIERWHNAAHEQIGMATGAPMMDARQNIYYRPFWQLHFYINDRFQTVLNQYGNSAHAGMFLSVDAVASHIEVSHHSMVRSI